MCSEEIHANRIDRLAHEAAVRTSTVNLGMPGIRKTAGRLTGASTTPDIVQP
ncbi:hypothetical protein HTZ77_30905 [Nonomuraea sp. SMC257]|uniref:Uncharacterized protein n=1 Tax=Nonomuraea montanisoli TaxID=2741721 RepID=A0A7Y6IDT9_9ACTN|nr:hypothetical protein [Nonomuraea montanisoli]NUW35798.1 hypothetical protein [Nonomuraea montanisoli]